MDKPQSMLLFACGVLACSRTSSLYDADPVERQVEDGAPSMGGASSRRDKSTTVNATTAKTQVTVGLGGAIEGTESGEGGAGTAVAQGGRVTTLVMAIGGISAEGGSTARATGGQGGAVPPETHMSGVGGGATAGSGGATAGSGGATAGSGGATAGSGGATAGSGGATAGSGGASSRRVRPVYASLSHFDDSGDNQLFTDTTEAFYRGQC